MTFYVFGVNHTTASLALREKIAFNPEHLSHCLIENKNILSDVVVVSTCNRMEICAHAESLTALTDWLYASQGILAESIDNHHYSFSDIDAVSHLIRVASGMDSLMLGEPQIFGQVKNALLLSQKTSVLSSRLQRVFDYVFHVAKKIRSETALGLHAVSMGYVVTQLARQVFSSLADCTVLLVGAGEMNRLVAQHLVAQGISRLVVCNRSIEHAQSLINDLSTDIQTEIIPFSALKQHLFRADIVCSCTASLYQMIEYKEVKVASKQRRYQAMLIIDLAVPRDIDPTVSKLNGVFLYAIDDLQAVLDENVVQRKQAALDAEIMVNQFSAQLVKKQRLYQAGKQIKQYRQRSKKMLQTPLEHSLDKIKQGHDPAQVLEELSYQLTNKLLHQPSTLLRAAATDSDPLFYQKICRYLDLEGE